MDKNTTFEELLDELRELHPDYTEEELNRRASLLYRRQDLLTELAKGHSE